MGNLPKTKESLKKCRQERLKECRLEAKFLTRQAVTDRAAEIQADNPEPLACSPVYLSKLETGQITLSAQYANLLGKVYKVSPRYLLGEIDYKDESMNSLRRVIDKAQEPYRVHNLKREALDLYLQILGLTVKPGKKGSTVKIYRGNDLIAAIGADDLNRLSDNIFEYADFEIEKIVRGF